MKTAEPTTRKNPVDRAFQAIQHLTDPSRGAKTMAAIAAIYCGLLSVESIYSAQKPQPLSWARAEKSYHSATNFVPKPFVDDGADLSRLLAVPNPLTMGSNLVVDVFGTQTGITKQDPGEGGYLWQSTLGLFAKTGNWKFLVAVAAALLIQGIEARAFRSLAIDIKRRKAERLNAIKRIQLDPKAIMGAQAAVADYNLSGTKRQGINAGVVVVTYLVEVWTFIAGFSGGPGASFFVQVIYGALTLFGFEAFATLADDDPNELKTDTGDAQSPQETRGKVRKFRLG